MMTSRLGYRRSDDQWAHTFTREPRWDGGSAGLDQGEGCSVYTHHILYLPHVCGPERKLPPMAVFSMFVYEVCTHAC